MPIGISRGNLGGLLLLQIMTVLIFGDGLSGVNGSSLT